VIMSTSSSRLGSFASLLCVSLTVAAAQWTCPASFSNGPCFTLAKNWTEAQRTCEQHGSNLATISDAELNANLGEGACFAPAPWNDWQCSWVGLNDLRNEGSFEWASGTPFSYENWGEYEPDTTEGNAQDCTAVCKGGSIDGYSGYFWVDLECDAEYTFCCDPSTFAYDAGTPTDSSFLASLEKSAATSTRPPPPAPDPNPYAERQLCFSSQLNWEDAQALCQAVDSHLLTIGTGAELDKLGQTVHFSGVSPSWGLDWKCIWTGLHDRSEEGSYEWISQASTGFIPPFGPFEGANGDGAEEDCVALCQSSCANSSAPGCMDLGEYGYVGSFLIDAKCSEEYAFCCDGAAAAVANRRVPELTEHEGEHEHEHEHAHEGDEHVHAHEHEGDDDSSKDATITALGVLVGVLGLATCVAIGVIIRYVRVGSGPHRTPKMTTISEMQVSTSGTAMYTPPAAGGV